MFAALAFLLLACGSGSWDEPVAGYEESGRERLQFRVYGADGISMPISPLQNHCDWGARAIKFRVVGEGEVRVFEGGWLVQSGAFITVEEAIAQELISRDPLLVGNSGELRFDSACVAPVFAGDPSMPDALFDVVADVVYFSAAP